MLLLNWCHTQETHHSSVGNKLHSLLGWFSRLKNVSNFNLLHTDNWLYAEIAVIWCLSCSDLMSTLRSRNHFSQVWSIYGNFSEKSLTHYPVKIVSCVTYQEITSVHHTFSVLSAETLLLQVILWAEIPRCRFSVLPPILPFFGSSPQLTTLTYYSSSAFSSTHNNT